MPPDAAARRLNQMIEEAHIRGQAIDAGRLESRLAVCRACAVFRGDHCPLRWPVDATGSVEAMRRRYVNALLSRPIGMHPVEQIEPPCPDWR